MSTRSRIGYVTQSGGVVSAYCHWDGYPSHNGRILLANYDTLAKVKALVDEGDMSLLDIRCNKPKGHTYEKPVKGYTVYYGRDRNETDVGAVTHANATLALSDMRESWSEFFYLFGLDGKWRFSTDGVETKKLTPAACKE